MRRHIHRVPPFLTSSGRTQLLPASGRRIIHLLTVVLFAACSDSPSSPPPNPAPTVTGITPAEVQRGAADVSVTVSGTGFMQQSRVRVDGNDQVTEFVNATTLRAYLPAADLGTARVAQLSVMNPAPGGGVSGAVELRVANPVPVLASLSPGSVATGSNGTTVTLVGTGFFPQTEVRVGGTARPAVYVSPTSLEVTLTAADLAAAGSVQFTAVNPEPGGGVSNAAALAVANPVPALSSISPATVLAGSAATVAVTGTGFLPQTEVRVGGTPRPTVYVSPTTLQVTLSAADLMVPAAVALTAVNPAPGGGGSNVAVVEVTNPAPVLSSLSPGTVLAGSGSTTLTLTGTGFVAQTQVRVRGSIRPRTTVSPTTLQVELEAADLDVAAPVEVTVSNPAPGGGSSEVRTVAVVNPVPAVTQLSPAVGLLEGTATVTVVGTGFRPQSNVFSGAAALPTAYQSPTALVVTLPTEQLRVAGTISLQVRTPAPGGGSSNTVQFEVRAPVPEITSVSPTVFMIEATDRELVVNGRGFAANSVVYLGTPRPTRYVSPTRLVATLTEKDLEGVALFPIVVETPGPGGGRSNLATIGVWAPFPGIVSLGSTQTQAGQSSYTLRVNGYGFVKSTQVLLDGVARPTTRVSAGQLDATLSESDLAVARTFQVTVSTPPPGGGTSGPVQFQVVASIRQNR
ncbi:MAG TPA: IPT/TIG domain-containing protein [Longimicrobium sp.]|nr:IPT/TIG domain-containing protein [Longimicrobium sp.]